MTDPRCLVIAMLGVLLVDLSIVKRLLLTQGWTARIKAGLRNTSFCRLGSIFSMLLLPLDLSK